MKAVILQHERGGNSLLWESPIRTFHKILRNYYLLVLLTESLLEILGQALAFALNSLKTLEELMKCLNLTSDFDPSILLKRPLGLHVI